MQEFRKVFLPYIQEYCDVCIHYYRGRQGQPAVCMANQAADGALEGIIVCSKVEYCTEYKFKSNGSVRPIYKRTKRNVT